MKFDYQLTGLGWADGHIEVNDQDCYFTASYLTDALGDFLHSLISILPPCVPEDELRQQASFKLNAEPGGTLWTLRRLADDSMNVQIVRYKDIEHEQEPLVEMDFEIKVIEFVKVVIERLDSLLRIHGIVGFRECWNRHDFPLAHFLLLKNYCMTRSAYEVIEYEERGCELARTSLDSDMQLLTASLVDSK